MPKKENKTGKVIEKNLELVSLVKRVRDHNDDIAYEAILSKLQDYIRSVTNRFYISGSDSNDIAQECLIALRFKAINDYDETKGPFIKFAKLCIRRHIITELKACTKRKNMALNTALSLDETYDDDSEDGGGSSLMDMIASEEEDEHFDTMYKRERGRYLYNYLSRKLTELEYQVLVYYLKGYNYEEIVNILQGDNVINETYFEGAQDEEDIMFIKKKIVDNALCRIKNKAKSINEQIHDGTIVIQGDMFKKMSRSIK